MADYPKRLLAVGCVEWILGGKERHRKFTLLRGIFSFVTAMQIILAVKRFVSARCRAQTRYAQKAAQEWMIRVKNHIDMLIFHTAICAGASQIALMADANLKFAPPRR